jgi:hypothetical protein
LTLSGDGVGGAAGAIPFLKATSASLPLTLALLWVGDGVVFSSSWCFGGGRSVRMFSSSVFSLLFRSFGKKKVKKRVSSSFSFERG